MPVTAEQDPKNSPRKIFSRDQAAQPKLWPNGRQFAFTIIDDTDTMMGDTDKGAISRLRPVYDLFLECGIKTTKTSWVLPGEEAQGCTVSLENEEYLKWILGLRDEGIEIAIHGAAGSSSGRQKIIRALDYYRELMGEYPRIHTNHVGNLDNIYWYADRLVGASSLAYRAYNALWRGAHATSLGHQTKSQYFWGDICREKISFVRNFVFQDINTLRNDPWMPYHSAHHPFVREWFSASDGLDKKQFVQLISERNQDRLMEEGGACIVYTHLAFGFTQNGKVDPTFASLIRRLSRLPGYFAPVSNVLETIKTQRGGECEISPSDLSHLQLRWLRDRMLANCRCMPLLAPKSPGTFTAPSPQWNSLKPW